MKRILIILSLLFAFVSSYGQVRTNPFYVPVAVAGCSVLVVTDDFTTAYNPLTNDPDWNTGRGLFKSYNGQAYSMVASDSAMVFYDPPFCNNQYAEVIVGTIGAGHYIGPAVRCSTNNGYGFVTDNNDWILNKLINGTWSVIASGSGITVIVTDVLRIEVTGTTITCYQNAVQITQQTDASLATGSAGMEGFGNGNSRATSFEGGNL